MNVRRGERGSPRPTNKYRAGLSMAKGRDGAGGCGTLPNSRTDAYGKLQGSLTTAPFGRSLAALRLELSTFMWRALIIASICLPLAPRATAQERPAVTDQAKPLPQTRARLPTNCATLTAMLKAQIDQMKELQTCSRLRATDFCNKISGLPRRRARDRQCHRGRVVALPKFSTLPLAAGSKSQHELAHLQELAVLTPSGLR